jgi:maltose/moltooligosaccharide transporter
VLRTREYPPDELRAFTDGGPAETKRETAEESTGGSTAAAGKARPVRNRALLWLAAGALGAALVAKLALDRQVYLVCGAMLVWGIALLIYGAREGDSAFDRIMPDFEARPRTMRRLAAVQFFTWIALFSMWLYTTPAITQVHFHTTDAGSDAYNEGANWVGVLFAAYSGYAALAAIAIPFMVRRLGLKLSHLVNLWLGALGLLSILWIRDPDWLLLSMAGVGCAWSSILSIPYALLSDSVPAEKMGLYMGFFNFFIVIPQLLAAAVLSNLLKIFFAGAPIYALVIGGACLLVAGALVLRVPEPPRSAGV